MKPSNCRPRFHRLLTAALSCALSFSTFQAASEDIDIFSVDVNDTVNKPNVLIVIDNSANWSRQAQKWPGGLTQGESEVRAIRDVIVGAADDPATPTINEFAPGLPNDTINVGVMEYITGGNSADTDSGMVRMDIQLMNQATKGVLAGHMNTIAANINSPDEKRSQGNPYGNLMWDVYNYLAGTNASQAGAGTIDALSDDNAYTTKHSVFQSPLTSSDTCTRTVVIFIGNNTSAGPIGDSAANVSGLAAVSGDTSQLAFQGYTVESTTDQIDAGYFSSGACYNNDAAGLSACTSAEASTATCLGNGFTSCLCKNTSTVACDSLKKFTIEGQAVATVVSPGVTPNPNTTTTSAAAIPSISTQCPNNQQTPSPQPSCPVPTDTTVAGPGAGQTTRTQRSWSGCSWVGVANSCGGSNNKTLFTARGTKTETVTVYEKALGALGPIAPAATSSCRTSAASCAGGDFPASCSNGTYENCACGAVDAPATAAGCGAAVGTVKYKVFGNVTQTVAIPNGTSRTPPTQSGNNFMADEWARFLKEQGVPLPNNAGRAEVTTYTIDVFNAQQDADISALLFNMSHVSGGKYFQAKNDNQLRDALGEIFSEVQAVNSAFASASLPVNATNRAQNENQVFIGLFRPDRTKRPRWFGNLKRYQAIIDGNAVTLGDNSTPPRRAVNPLTGFLTDCAVSFWTTATGNYWLNVTTDDPPAVSNCGLIANSQHSDLPDGPFVEKGAVAEVIRNGNGNSTQTEGNFSLNRTMKTRSGGSLVDFSSSSLPDVDWDGDTVLETGGEDTTVKNRIANFIKGQDVFDDDNDHVATKAPTTGRIEPRSTVHGDVIHSRPQPVNYGDADGNSANGIDPGVVVYYGSNDGTFRAVSANTGRELWSFVAPEHYLKFKRLTNNTPNITYFNDPPGAKKDYFFDGSTGLLQTSDNSKIYVFPTMRRGGRKVYAFNVTSTDSPLLPTYLWSRGCDDAGNCDDDDGDPGTSSLFANMGQTWSLPSPGFIAGVSSGTQPVVLWGGGYDTCEDANTATPACAAPNGRGAYVLNADTGALLRYFDLSGFSGARSVTADLALIDINADGKADHAYAVDTGGSIYRMTFLKADGTAETNPALWSVRRVARTTGSGRKFLFPPALFQASSKVMYVAIGSGDREAPLINQYPYDANGDGSAVNDSVLNRFYMVKDDLTNVQTEIALDSVSSSNMQNYTTEASPCCNAAITPGDPATNDGDADTAGWDTQPKGWFIDLSAQGRGEQVVTSAVVLAGFVIFSTNRPTAPSVQACSNSLGEARGYVVNLFNASGAICPSDAECSQGGTRSGVFTGGGLPPSPVVAVIPIGGRLETVVIGAIPKDAAPGGSFSPIDITRPPLPIRIRRTPVYWFKSLDTD